MDKTLQNIEDIKFIISEIRRFSSMPWPDLEHRREDSSYTLPSLSGIGSLICGQEAGKRLIVLTERYSDTQQDLKNNIDITQLKDAITIQLVQRFLKGEKEVDRRNVDKMLSAARRKLKATQKSLTHYIPCVVVSSDEPEEFAIGPVRFIRMEKFLLDQKEELEIERQRIYREHIKRCEEAKSKYPENCVAIPTRSAELAARLIDDLTTYFSSFKWVATVKIPECDEKTSRQRAELAVEAALNMLKLFFGAYHNKKLRQGHIRGRLDATANLTRETDGSFNISLVGPEAQDVFAEEGWFQKMSGETGSWYLRAASSALDSCQNPNNSSHLKQRFLDALAWYGQAVSEQTPSAQIIRYVAAWERITTTKREDEYLSQIVTRRTALLSIDKDRGFQERLKNAKEVYNCRSRLMHGTCSPFDKALQTISSLAEEVTRKILFKSLEIFDLLVNEFPNPKPTDLEQKYLSLEKNFSSSPKRYAIIIEKSETSYGAYVPDLPGCEAVGETLEEVRTLIHKAIQSRLEGL